MMKFDYKELPKYLHITFDDNLKLVSKDQRTGYLFKPIGFYYAKGTEWLDFYATELCGSDSDVIFTDQYVEIKNNLQIYEVIIDNKNKIKINQPCDKNKILFIDNKEDLERFAEIYGYYNPKPNFSINWNVISNDYAGIKFDNYHRLKSETFNMSDLNETLKYTWFLGFDVNGGCIWNINSIEISNLIKK